MSAIIRSLGTTAVFASLFVVTACTEPLPIGPMVWVAPPQGAIPPQVKTFLTLVQDDQQCRIHAEIAVGWVQAGETGPQAPIGMRFGTPRRFDLQTTYNIAYSQCMTALGNTVRSLPVGGYAG